MEPSNVTPNLQIPSFLHYLPNQTDSTIHLSNQSNNFLLFKIKSTDCSAVIVDNYEGRVAPWHEKDITVSLTKDLTGKVRLLVILAFVGEERQDWKISAIDKDLVYSKQIHIVGKVDEPQILPTSLKSQQFKTQELDLTNNTNNTSLDQKQSIILPPQTTPTSTPKVQTRKFASIPKPKLQAKTPKAKHSKLRSYNINWTLNLGLFGIMATVFFIGSKLNVN